VSLSLPVGCSVVSLVRVDELCSSRSPGREELEVVEESMLAEELALDFSDEEVLAYYISFLKTLSFKLNKHTIHFF